MEKKIIKFDNLLSILIFFTLYISLLFGFFFNEDSLGGAHHDYSIHLRFISLFKNNILNGLNSYGINEFEARNSPVYYVILSIINNFISLENFRIVNTFTSILTVYLFFICLKKKYKNINFDKLIIFSSVIFLSPTIRSLSIWPYPLTWGLIFFIISIYYFLKFNKSKKNRLKYALFNTFFLSISAYFYVPFAAFVIYFLYNFFKSFTFKNFLFVIVPFNFILSAPAIVYLISHDFFLFKAQGIEISIYESLNPINKIFIILSIVFFFLTPFLKIKFNEIFFELYNRSFFYLVIYTFILFLSVFFNFKYSFLYGGGFYFKLSNLLFQNNILFIFFVILSIPFLKNTLKLNSNNLILILSLFFFNLQYTIYNKYYDPLILILFSLLMNANYNFENFFKNNSIFKLYCFYIFYFLISVFKNFL